MFATRPSQNQPSSLTLQSECVAPGKPIEPKEGKSRRRRRVWTAVQSWSRNFGGDEEHAYWHTRTHHPQRFAQGRTADRGDPEWKRARPLPNDLIRIS